MNNITQCAGRKSKCLGNFDCCYECSFNGWCQGRCKDSECRRECVAKRLNIRKK